MIFVDDINTGNIVSSKNAGDIFLEEITSSNVLIDVETGDETYEFQISHFDGTARIRTREILQSLKLRCFSSLPAGDSHESLAEVYIYADKSTDDEAVWHKYVFDGGYADGAYPGLTNNTFWWTWRAQISRTYKHGREFIGALFTDSSQTVSVKATFRDGTSQTVTIATVSVTTPTLYVFDVSYSRIANLFPGKNIDFYDICGTSKFSHRYIVLEADPSVIPFVFRNTLGLFDTVYARGQFSGSVKTDVKTFINDAKEVETFNGSRESLKAYTGYLDTDAESDLWEDFFRSDERYVINDGLASRIVIDSVDLQKVHLELSSASFEYHFSEAPRGRFTSKYQI